MTRIKRLITREPFLTWVLATLVTFITFAPLIQQLGYYQDDWYLLWSGQARGVHSIITLFTTDRPFMGYIYALDYALLGDTVLHWHLWALFLRLVGVWALLWLLRMLWPQKKAAALAAVLIFIVYPGFLSQPIANTFQNHLFTYSAAILSIALLVAAVQSQQRWKTIILYLLSLLFTSLYLPVYEYMIGLEGLKLVFLWVALQLKGQSISKQLLPLSRWYLPFALISTAFVYWRFFIFESTRHATSEAGLLASYLSGSLRKLLGLLIETGKDIMDTAFYSWAVPTYRLFASASYRNLALALLWAGLAVILVAGYYFLLYRKQPEWIEQSVDLPFSRWLVLAGVFGVFITLLPVSIAGRQVLFNGFERYTLQASLGVALLFTGLLCALHPRFRMWLLLGMVALGSSTHYLNAASWADTWQMHRTAWWQLTWRAPALQDDTLVMLYLPEGYRLQQDYEAWGPLNLIYHPGAAEAPLIQSEVLNEDTSYDVLQLLERENQVREIPVLQDFNNLLLLSVPSPLSCLHVIDGQLPFYSEFESLLVKQVGEYSNIDRILTSGAAPVPSHAIFGAEPEHGWCYYYQSAALARQRGDWAEAAHLGDQAIAAGLEPLDKSEWLVFIEAYVNLGRYQDVQAIYQQDIKGRRELRLPLCRSLADDPGYPPEFGYDYIRIYEILCDS